MHILFPGVLAKSARTPGYHLWPLARQSVLARTVSLARQGVTNSAARYTRVKGIGYGSHARFADGSESALASPLRQAHSEIQ